MKKNYRQLTCSINDNTKPLQVGEPIVLDIDFQQGMNNVKSIVFNSITFTNNHLRVNTPNKEFTIYIVFQREDAYWDFPKTVGFNPARPPPPDFVKILTINEEIAVGAYEIRQYASYVFPVKIKTDKNYSIRQFVKALNNAKERYGEQPSFPLTNNPLKSSTQAEFKVENNSIVFDVTDWLPRQSDYTSIAWDAFSYTIGFDGVPSGGATSYKGRIGIALFDDNPYNELCGFVKREETLPHISFAYPHGDKYDANGNLADPFTQRVKNKKVIAPYEIDFYYNATINLETNSCFKPKDSISMIANKNINNTLFSVPILTKSGDIFYFENKYLANEIEYKETDDFKLEKIYIKLADEFYEPIIYNGTELCIITFLISFNNDQEINEIEK